MTTTKRFRFEFQGRLNGAIGITYPHIVEVEAEDEDAARLRLYESYEHISISNITPLSTNGINTDNL